MTKGEGLGAYDLETVIDQVTRERLRHPVVVSLYEVYCRSGIVSPLSHLVGALPADYQKPVVHTLGSHVTKEKPVFVYALSPEDPEREPAFKTLAASIDLLWCLSLIYDDAVDQDQNRAGKTAAWVQYGREFSMQAAQMELAVITGALKNHFGESAESLDYHVARGIESIEDHARLTFESSREEIVGNYLRRADFHTTFPVELLFTQENSLERKTALEAIKDVNLAGQILNDLKDLSPRYAWIREGFSDVRGGLVTLPVKILWERLNPSQRERLTAIFGQKKMIDQDTQFMIDTVLTTGAVAETIGIARSYYQKSEDCFREASRKDLLSYPLAWIKYKLYQLAELETEFSQSRA